MRECPTKPKFLFQKTHRFSVSLSLSCKCVVMCIFLFYSMCVKCHFRFILKCILYAFIVYPPQDMLCYCVLCCQYPSLKWNRFHRLDSAAFWCTTLPRWLVHGQVLWNFINYFNWSLFSSFAFSKVVGGWFSCRSRSMMPMDVTMGKGDFIDLDILDFVLCIMFEWQWIAIVR